MQTVNLEVTQELLNLIVAGLNELQTKYGAPAIAEIKRQVEEQMEANSTKETVPMKPPTGPAEADPVTS